MKSESSLLNKIKHTLQSVLPAEDHPTYRYWVLIRDSALDLFAWARRIYHRIDRVSGNRLSLVKRALRRFSKNRGAEAAASISFFTIFSIFPLLIFITSAASMFLDSEVVKENVLNWLTDMLPVVPEVILAEIESLINVRTTTVNLVALVSFLWSASGAFNALARSLHRVWNPDRQRNAVLNRLLGLAMVASLVVLVMVLLMGSSVITVILGRGLAFGGRLTLHFVPIAIRVLIFWITYSLVPGGKVNNTSALWGAILASCVWEVNTLVFTWYIKSGLAEYEILYGSLGTIIALLMWVYLSYFIYLLGAYIAEADGYRKKKIRLAATKR